MAVLKLFVLLLATAAAGGAPAPRQLSQYKKSFYHNIKSLVFQRIIEYFSLQIKDPASLTFAQEVNEGAETAYDYKSDDSTDSKTVVMRINNIEIFKIKISPNLIVEDVKPVEPQLEPVKKTGDGTVLTEENVSEIEQPVGTVSNNQVEEPLKNIGDQPIITSGQDGHEIIKEPVDETHEQPVVGIQEEVVQFDGPQKNQIDQIEDPERTNNLDEPIEYRRDEEEVPRQERTIEEPGHIEAQDLPDNKTNIEQPIVGRKDGDTLGHEDLRPTRKDSHDDVEEDPSLVKKTGEVIKNGNDRKRGRVLGAQDRKLAMDLSRNLNFEIFNSVIGTTISLQYGYGGQAAIQKFVMKSLNNFLFESDQVVYALSQIADDLSILLKVEFARQADSQLKGSRSKSLDAYSLTMKDEDVPLDPDVDANFEKLAKASLFADASGLKFVAQNIDLEKADPKIKAYFTARLQEVMEAQPHCNPKHAESLIQVLTPSNISLDPVEMLIFKCGPEIYVRAMSSHFDFTHELNISTKRFIIKNFERIVKRIRDGIYKNLIALQDSQNTRYSLAECEEILRERFRPMMYKVRAEEGGQGRVVFRSADGIKRPFTLTLATTSTDMSLTLATDDPGVLRVKSYPLVSLYSPMVFFRSYVYELWKDLTLVIPSMHGTSKENEVVVDPPNNHYYKNMMMPFVKITEGNVAVKGTSVYFNHNAEQARNPENYELRMVFHPGVTDTDSSSEVNVGLSAELTLVRTDPGKKRRSIQEFRLRNQQNLDEAEEEQGRLEQDRRRQLLL